MLAILSVQNVWHYGELPWQMLRHSEDRPGWVEFGKGVGSFLGDALGISPNLYGKDHDWEHSI